MLRATGRPSEADAIEATELVVAKEQMRGAPEDFESWDEHLLRIREAEEARIADAVALAELLAPLLSQRLQLGAAPVAQRPVAPSAAVLIRPARTPAAQRGIADFIDDMIAQAAPKI